MVNQVTRHSELALPVASNGVGVEKALIFMASLSILG
jgi:hypothetical protein